jgi:hypothetical protein
MREPEACFYMGSAQDAEFGVRHPTVETAIQLSYKIWAGNDGGVCDEIETVRNRTRLRALPSDRGLGSQTVHLPACLPGITFIFLPPRDRTVGPSNGDNFYQKAR